MVKNHLLLEELRVAYDQVVAENISNNIRSIALCDFEDKFNVNPRLQEIVVEFAANEKRARESLQTCEEESLEQMKSASSKIKAYAEANSLTAITEMLERLDQTQFLSDMLSGLNLGLVDVLSVLIEGDRPDRYEFASQFGKITCSGLYPTINQQLEEAEDEEQLNVCGFLPGFYQLGGDKGRLGPCFFAPSFYRLDEERQKFSRIQQAAVWDSWNKVVEFCFQYKNGEQKPLAPADVFHVHRVFSYTKNALPQEESESMQLPSEERANVQQQNNVSLDDEQLANEPQELYWCYNSEKRIFSVNKKDISFKGCRGATNLALLVKNIKNKKYELFWDVAHAKYEGITPEEVTRMGSGDKDEIKTTFYYACKSMCNRIAQVDMAKFLNFDKEQAIINPRWVNNYRPGLRPK